MTGILRKNMGIVTLLGSLALCILFSFRASAEITGADIWNLQVGLDGEDYTNVDDSYGSIYLGGEYYPEYKLPEGVSYDPASNTLTITDCSCKGDFITYAGTRDLHIQVNGENSFTGGSFLTYQRELYVDKGGDVYIEGSGSITSTNLTQYGSTALIELATQAESANTKDGDIYINGVTLTSNADGIISNFSNVYIKNAKLIVNGYQGKKADYGITAGRITSVYGAAFGNPAKAFEGMISIENSEIEIRNCITALACNQYKITGNCYVGETSAQYSVDAVSLFNHQSEYEGGLFRQLAEYGYLRITNQDLGLPKITPETIYRITVDSSNPDSRNGTVTVSKDTATPGDVINITATPNSGYVLTQLQVNGTSITGTSFTMPKMDTIVKAFFEKEKTPSSEKEMVSQGDDCKVTSISIEGDFTKLAVGKKITLKAVVEPENATNKVVTWSVSNKKYATVSSNGVVRTKKAGAGRKVTVTAEAADGSGIKATYKISIMKGTVQKITLKGNKTVKAGKSTKLKATVKATSGANKKLLYISSNLNYATVTKKGVVQTKAAGKGKTVTITAKATDGSKKKAKIKIKIK